MPNPRALDIIIASKEIREIIRDRVEESNLSLKKLVADVRGLNYDTFVTYLRCFNPLDGNVLSVKQNHIIEILSKLGVSVKLTIVKHPIDTIDVEKYSHKTLNYWRKQREEKVKKDIDEFFKD